MKHTVLLFLAATSFFVTAPSSEARPQFGIGPSLYTGTEFDGDYGYGLNAEIGTLMDSTPIDLFLGVRASYIDGIGGDGNSNLDIFDGSLEGRVLLPLGFNFLKLYGEGRVGLGNLRVSGDVKAKARVNGREVTVNSHIDGDDWTFGYGVGAGVQLDLGGSIGLRVGYEWTSYGDMEVLGFDKDPGAIHGASASLIIKF